MNSEKKQKKSIESKGQLPGMFLSLSLLPSFHVSWKDHWEAVSSVYPPGSCLAFLFCSFLAEWKPDSILTGTFDKTRQAVKRKYSFISLTSGLAVGIGRHEGIMINYWTSESISRFLWQNQDSNCLYLQAFQSVTSLEIKEGSTTRWLRDRMWEWNKERMTGKDQEASSSPAIRRQMNGWMDEWMKFKQIDLQEEGNIDVERIYEKIEGEVDWAIPWSKVGET